MGSTFTTSPDKYDQTSLLGTKTKLPVYLQFVPGVVLKVITGLDSVSIGGNENRNIGSIIAQPHISEKTFSKASLDSSSETFRYIPLLRGIQDVPTTGDPVLLCTMGGINYYLGPLNTDGNPNFNKDNFKNKSVKTVNGKNLPEGTLETKLFRKGDYSRLQKLLNPKLDSPHLKVDGDTAFIDPTKFLSNTIHGDLVLEGRHGNSLRVGSRSKNPYFIISNGRGENSPIETSLDGTILGIFNNGSIRDHFNLDPISEKTNTNYKFSLADEEYASTVQDVDARRSISKTFTTSMGRGLGGHENFGGDYIGTDDSEIVKTIYGYDKNQLFASSGRITFNARDESMFLASRKFIHLGSGDNMTFSCGKTFLIDSATSVITKTNLFKVQALDEVVINSKNKHITLGNPEPPPAGDGDLVQPAVLGTGLMMQLVLIIYEIQNLAYATASAIEGRSDIGASVSKMQDIVDALDNLMGMELHDDGSSSEMIPKTISDIILSKKVRLK